MHEFTDTSEAVKKFAAAQGWNLDSVAKPVSR
jgi:hypothetical protein